MKISVVVPALNAASSLLRALESVWRQTHQDFELIVMDGGSKDGTRQMLEQNNSRITFWRSEADRGTTEAMNRGFAQSTGDLVTFLCSDDQFHNEHVFKRVIQEFKDHPETEVLCAGLEVVDPEGQVRTFRSFSRPERLNRGMTVHLPGAFFRRGVLHQPPFSEKAEVANDYELFAYLQQKQGANIRVLNEVTVTFSLGGRTNDPATDFWKARELYAIRRRYYGFWGAGVRFCGEWLVAVLRKMHFRPFRWGRKIRRALLGG